MIGNVYIFIVPKFRISIFGFELKLEVGEGGQNILVVFTIYDHRAIIHKEVLKPLIILSLCYHPVASEAN